MTPYRHVTVVMYATQSVLCAGLCMHRDFLPTTCVACMMGMAEDRIKWFRVGTVWLVALSTWLSLLPGVQGAAIPYFWPRGR